MIHFVINGVINVFTIGSDHIEDWILVAKDAAKQTKNEVPADRPFDEHWEICAKVRHLCFSSFL